MKLRSLLAGVAIGALLTVVAATFANPPAHPRVEPIVTQRPTGERVESFFIEVPRDGIAVSNSGQMLLAPFPADVPLFDEERIRNSLAVLCKVRDANGEMVGYASELEVFTQTDLSQGDVVWNTDWTLVLPARGALFLHQQEHAGELFPKVVGPVLASGEDWEGDWTVTTTVGPRPDGRGVIVGGTGEFAGARGTFVEIGRLTRFTPRGEMFITVELETVLEPAT